MFAVIAMTQVVRERRMDAVAALLPTSLMCRSCHATGRSVYDAFARAVRDIFSVPYPDLQRVFEADFWTASALVQDCPSASCTESALSYGYEGSECANISRALDQVPQQCITMPW